MAARPSWLVHAAHRPRYAQYMLVHPLFGSFLAAPWYVCNRWRYHGLELDRPLVGRRRS